MIRIYNLFPQLAGPAKSWGPHIERAAALGFTHLYLNPIQQGGFSGSPYSVRDHFAVDDRIGTYEDVAAALSFARRLGLAPIADLVAGHTAIDSPLVREKPHWFVRGRDGRAAHPGCMDNGKWLEWGDLAKLDHHGRAKGELGGFLDRVGKWHLDLGFLGFRCDAAYQLPRVFWKIFIARMRKTASSPLLFFAENLGCKVEESAALAGVGFDLLASSVMWWDFEAPWHRIEYEATYPIAPLVSFPETHDTERAFARAEREAVGPGGAVDHRLARRIFRRTLLFTWFYGGAWMMPAGCEFAFRNRVRVVGGTAEDWETPVHDERRFVRSLARLDDRFSFSRRARVEERRVDGALLFEKESGRERLVLVVNPTRERHGISADYLPRGFLDATPESSRPWVSSEPHFILEPGEARLLAAGTRR